MSWIGVLAALGTASPTSARHGLRWWGLDGSYLLIRLLGHLGLAWNIRTSDADTIARRRA